MFTTIVLVIIAGVVIYKVIEYKKEAAEEVADAQESGNERLKHTRLNAKWRIIESWSELIPGAEGKQTALMDAIKKTLHDIAAPNLHIEHRKVSLSGMTNIFSGARKQLVIESKRLYGYHVFVSIEDYGKQLNVSWYLMVRENLLTKLMRASGQNKVADFFLTPIILILTLFYAARSYSVPEMMNVFDREELTAYTTTVHHAILQVVEDVMSQMNMDFSKVDTKTRGFLNIS